MSLAKRAWAGLLILAPCVLAVGCRGGAVPTASPQAVRLREVHEMYRHYIKSHQKPPHQLSDLASKQYEGVSPAAVEALKRGDIVAVWDVAATDGGTVLAYEKDAPTNGGAVVMADGTVQTMTADALKAAIPPPKK